MKYIEDNKDDYLQQKLSEEKNMLMGVQIFSQIVCLKDWFSPLDRSSIVHRKGEIYKLHNSPATKYGFYASDCDENEMKVIVQIGDLDYKFL